MYIIGGSVNSGTTNLGYVHERNSRIKFLVKDETMEISELGIHASLKAYRIVNKMGILDTSAMQFVFRNAYFAYKRVIEDPFHRLLSQYPGFLKGGHVLDIGANLGYTTTLFANFIDSNFKVFAFEPDVKNFKHLQRCASSRIEVFQMAVGETSGSITLWHNPNHHADHRVVTAAFKDSLSSDALLFSVPQISIDEFLSSNSVREPLSFIKMDIQGYELPACWGMQETLKNNPNAVIAIEYFPGAMEELGYKAEALLDFFYDRGYELYPFSRRDSLRRLDKANLCDLVRSKGYTDLLASRQKIA